MRYGECFDSATVIDVQNKISELDDSKFGILMTMNLQKPTIMLLIAILLGWERFWLVDIFTVTQRTYRHNYEKFNETLMFCR